MLLSTLSAQDAYAQDKSLRIGTLNTYFKPTFAFVPPLCFPIGVCELLPPDLSAESVGPCTLPAGGAGVFCAIGDTIFTDQQIADGAIALAARIKAGGYDVIALQEVFNETAKDILIQELEVEYPIIFVRADTIGEATQDSGLMLFAKGHLEFISDPAHTDCGGFEAPASGWKVVVRTPQNGSGDCEWISNSPAQQCGPNGVPYAAFREFGPHATAVEKDDSSIGNKGVVFVNLLDTSRRCTGAWYSECRDARPNPRVNAIATSAALAATQMILRVASNSAI